MDAHAHQSSPSPIFIWDGGRPCRFFIEATSVRERPKLVRRIIKHSGVVVNAVREADILLAENNTKEALELLDAWKGDKIILGTRWVASCIEQDCFIGANRGWGGHLLKRDSLLKNINAHDDESEDESEDGQIHVKPVSRTARKPPSHLPRPEPPRSQTSHTPPFSGARIRSTSNGRSRGEQSHSPSRSSHIPAPQTPPIAFPHPDSNMLLPTDAMPSSSQLQYPMSSQANTPQQLFPSMHNTLLQQPQQVSNPFQSQLPQYSPFNLAAVYSQFSPAQVRLFQQWAGNPQLVQMLELMSNGTQPQQLMDQDNLADRPTPEDIMSPDATHAISEDEASRSPPSRRKKGKARARSPSHDSEIQTAIRSRPISSRPTVKEDRGFFVDDWGMPRKFYIMVDLKNRKDLLKIVKKHGGTIVSDMELADHIILNSRSNQFQKLLGTVPLEKIALSPTWVESCDSEGRVVEMAPFVIDVTSGVGQGAQRKRPVPRKLSKAGTVELESEDEHPARFEGVSMTSPSATSRELPGSAVKNRRPHSRSPSPPRNVVVLNTGRKTFTQEDRIWFFKYMRFKMERNPEASITSLVRMVARKAPHHSASSWEGAWRKNWSDEMAALKEDIVRLHGHPQHHDSSPPPAVADSETRHGPPQPSPRSIAQISPSSSPVPQNEVHLQYPEHSSSPLRTPNVPLPPPSSAPVSQATTQMSPVRTQSEIRLPPSSPPVSQASTQARPLHNPSEKRPLTVPAPRSSTSMIPLHTSPDRPPPPSSNTSVSQAIAQAAPTRSPFEKRPPPSSPTVSQPSAQTNPMRTISETRPRSTALHSPLSSQPGAQASIFRTPPKAPAPSGSSVVTQASVQATPLRTPSETRPPTSSNPQMPQASAQTSPTRAPSVPRTSSANAPVPHASVQPSLTLPASEVRQPPNGGPVSQASTQVSHLRTVLDAWYAINGPATSQTSMQMNPASFNTETLKRKESPVETQVNSAGGNGQAKRPKVDPDNVIDVDSYPDGWFQPR